MKAATALFEPSALVVTNAEHIASTAGTVAPQNAARD